MSFPDEWLEYDMYPDELFIIQFDGYEIGNEDGSEHDRNGAFHWWLKKKPNKEELMKLTRLTFLDSEQLMAEDVRSYILKASSFDKEVEELMKELYMNRLRLIAEKRES